VSAVVSDTSPIRALHHLGLLALLRDFFGEVFVPPTVVAELREVPERFTPIDLAGSPWFRVRAPARADLTAALREELDAGEAEAISLAVEIGASVVLIDERAGREVVRRLNMLPMGALGVLLRAKQNGMIPMLGPLIERLRTDAEFFVSDSVVEGVLRQAGEQRGP
jgi:predicted nucleic acid-binding protein